MSDIDLSAAIQAGVAAGDKVNPRLYAASDVAVAVSEEAVLAAAPLIEAAVREQVAQENVRLLAYPAQVEEYAAGLLGVDDENVRQIGRVLLRTARWARGES